MSEGVDKLREILKVFTYRPGWRFEIRDNMLIVTAVVINTDNTDRMIPLQFAQGIPTFVREDFAWERWLLAQIMAIEEHEAREFFKVNGVKVFDPHG